MKLYYTKATSLTILALELSLLSNNVDAFSAPNQFSSLSNHAFTSSQTKIKSPTISSSTLAKKYELYNSASAVGDNQAPEPMLESIGEGIKRDYKARLPLYKSDITDGLNTQCLAATLFLFFACLAPAVGFGGLFAAATGGAIGTIEMVSSTAGKISNSMLSNQIKMLSNQNQSRLLFMMWGSYGVMRIYDTPFLVSVF
jgi:hypothetical protein